MERFQAVAKELGLVMVLPMYEEEQPGVYYNTAAVIDADGTYLGKYRKHHIPHLTGFWEKFYFRPGNLGYPVFDTAVGKVGVYICYDRHFPEGWRELGLNGAQLVFNPSATKPRAVATSCGSSSSRRRPSPTSTSSAAINRVGIEEFGDDGLLRHELLRRPAGNFVGDVGDADKPELVVRDLDLDDDHARSATTGQFYRDRRPDAYDGRSCRADDHRCSITERHRLSVRPASSRQDVLIDGETIAAVLAPGSAALGDRCNADTVIDATGKYVIPGGIDAHTHMELPFGGTDGVGHASRPAPARRPGAARRRSSTSPCSARASGCRTGSPPWHDKAAGNCAIDYGFHQIIGGVDDESLKAMDELIDEGITSFKLFMAYPGVFLLRRRADPARHADGGRQRRR